MSTVTAAPDTTASLPRVDPRTMRNSVALPKLGPGAHLVIDDGETPVVVAVKDGLTKIGRGFSVDIRLEEPTLSRRHAILSRRRGDTTILDDRSANGVFVNGERIDRAVLRHGDVVTLGRVTLRYVEILD
jgi:pSer/pThr/pTyr-binding forkhead associated (FHA) protein